MWPAPSSSCSPRSRRRGCRPSRRIGGGPASVREAGRSVQLDALDRDRVALALAVHGGPQVIGLLRGLQRGQGLFVALLIELQELAVGADDAVAALRALQRARGRVGVRILRDLLLGGAHRVDEGDVLPFLGGGDERGDDQYRCGQERFLHVLSFFSLRVFSQAVLWATDGMVREAVPTPTASRTSVSRASVKAPIAISMSRTARSKNIPVETRLIAIATSQTIAT